MTCDEMPEAEWAEKRFDGRCYFYPGRDCPGYAPGSLCGRIGITVPTLEELWEDQKK